ncbi:AAA family ATPase [Desulfospira joergensenii]|uniref:AAA family ATPase n=1 Tax=Desulfospira joergensenii TaxID=53329 RepID=UPI0003B60213|nr:AAA family ATPase [Desulfospira joergensenii]
MKILELRFKNLNSLYGEWFIDFTDPEYIANGIFALTGPTGAGKSTILDAICLGLYGATPRLGKITKSGNEIMSRQTGECYAEVMFESQAGRFRCHWAQHRARKRADGNLIDARHEISDMETGKPIETKKSLVPGVIEEKTGMDFDRFTRSILLAQGGFDTFLKADVEQKSRILEQITGTGIYSEISRRVHERQRDEREKLNLLQAETSGIAILEPEQEKEIQKDLENKQEQEIRLAAQKKEIQKAVTWLIHLEELKKEIRSLSEETKTIQTEIKAFKPEGERLDRALKAAEWEGRYATLAEIRKQQTQDQAALEREKERLPKLEEDSEQREKALAAAEQKTLKARAKLKQTAPLIQKVRSLDLKLAEQEKALFEGEKSCKKEAAKIESHRELEHREKEKQIQARRDLELVEHYLKDHSQDEWLLGGLAGVEEQLNRILSRQEEIRQKAIEREQAGTALEQATKKLRNSEKQFRNQKKELDQAARSLLQGKDVLRKLLGNRMLREYRSEKETLLREMAFLARIAELEVHRSRLEDGRACPLCGSREHPFAQGNVPVPDKTEKKIEALSERIRKAEAQEAAINKLETDESEARNHLTESEKHQTAAANEKQTAQKHLSDLTKNLNIARAGFEELKKAVSVKLLPLGIDRFPEDVPSLVRSLRDRLEKWQVQVKKRGEIEKRIFESEGEVKRLNAVIETQAVALAEKQKALESIRKEWDDSRRQRRELYKDKDPDIEELGLNKGIDHAEAAEKQTRTLNDEARQKLNSAKTRFVSLEEGILQRESELEKLEKDFSASIQSAGFFDEKEFLAARLGGDERARLTAKAKDLDDRRTDLRARQKDRENRLAMEIAGKITDKTRGELEPELEKSEKELEQLRDAIAGLKHTLFENKAARERIKEKQALIQARKKECLRWEKLHGLIGSADGKKYRNFAQGLTFELMVAHANRQLEKMTDRYLLIRDENRPLELNVVDNYQAGEIRSTQNLSGGESFIVSLTLALGLSKMASRKVRVDSLFLDEGFGTLDDEALETALETLSGLHQDGKLIGIISHVSALKERIATQITVQPITGGKSGIIGPGCQKAVNMN